MNYEWIKALASQTGRKIPDLLALARANDPFFAGCPAQQRDAEWFLQIWTRFGFGKGVHLRRIHYRIISDRDPVICPNGKPYENTLESWNYLGAASKAARYLRLVDPASFVDRRNPDPRIYTTSREPLEPGCEIDGPQWTLPSISIQIESRLDLPVPFVYGYGYRLADQRYQLEIWIEKSTMDDVLDPLCQRYGIDLVTGIGFQSITTVITMLRERVDLYRKPTRIFYISDFDPAGEHMPVATARQIEFWRQDYAPDMEIKLVSLALSREQVIQYRLPRTPIKESDRRKKWFEDRHGEGAVELDALEALYPGELTRIVTNAIEPYFDEELPERLADTYHQVLADAEADWNELIEDEAAELEEIKDAAATIVRKYRPRAAKLTRDFSADLKPIQARLDAVRHVIQEKAGEFEITLPGRPQAVEADVDESAWLFDSSRSYLDQLDCYRRYKGTSNGDTEEKE
jgi:hypothetical protein